MSNGSTVNGNGVSTQFPTLSHNIGTSGALAGRSATSDESESWFAALAKAWGGALDKQATRITELSSQITSVGSPNNAAGGADNPSTLTMLTAESLKMQFLSQSASSSNNAVGQALETLGRKQ